MESAALSMSTPIFIDDPACSSFDYIIYKWDAVVCDNDTWDYFLRNCHLAFSLSTHFHYPLLSVGFSLYRGYLNVLEKISL